MFVSFLLPATATHSSNALFDALLNKIDDVLAFSKNFEVKSGFQNERMISSNSLVFSNRVYFYIDADLGNQRKMYIENFSGRYGLEVIVRDNAYVKIRADMSNPVAFISHDSIHRQFTEIEGWPRPSLAWGSFFFEGLRFS